MSTKADKEKAEVKGSLNHDSIERESVCYEVMGMPSRSLSQVAA